MADRATSAMGGKKSKSKKSSKHPHSIHVRRGKSGGFIAEHHFKSAPDEPVPEPEEHVLPDISALQDHMAEHMGDQPEQEVTPAAEPSPAGPAPVPAAPAGV